MEWVIRLAFLAAGIWIGMEIEQRWPKLNDAVKADIRAGVSAAYADLRRELQELRDKIEQEMAD